MNVCDAVICVPLMSSLGHSKKMRAASVGRSAGEREEEEKRERRVER